MSVYGSCAWSASMSVSTGCDRNNSHILKVNKNQTKQGTEKFFYL